MPADATHGSNDRPLPPAFTQRSSRDPEPAAGEQPLMPPYFHGDRGSSAAAAPAPWQAAAAAGTTTEDWGDEPWAATPDYEDPAPAAPAKLPEPVPITDFLVAEEPEPEPQPVEAYLAEVVDPLQALVQGVTLLDEPEALSEPIDAETLAYIEAVALGESSPTEPRTTDAETELDSPGAALVSLDAVWAEAEAGPSVAAPEAGVGAAAAEEGPGAPDASAPLAEPPAQAVTGASDIAAEAARAASAASAWPPEVLRAIGAASSDPGAASAPAAADPAVPAEIEPPMELRPVGFEALASEILAGAQAPAAPEETAAEPADAVASGAAPAGAATEGEAEAWAGAPADETPAESVEPSTALAPAVSSGAVLDPAALELVERLEAAARRLREHGAAGLAVDLLNGDRFDAMLAGVLTGFLAARRG